MCGKPRRFMNKITIYHLESENAADSTVYTAAQIRLNASEMSCCNLDLNSGNELPRGIYTVRELGIRINVFGNDDNRHQFWTL